MGLGARKLGHGRLLLLALWGAQPMPSDGARALALANPIRRVVTMLQSMQQKVTAEGLKEKQLFDKYMCYCEKSGSSLKKSVAAAEAKVPQLESSIKESTAESDRLKADIKQAKADKAESEEALSQAQKLSDSELKAIKKEIEEDVVNMKAIDQALKALRQKGGKGGKSGFLQTDAAARLQQLTVSLDMSTADRDLISSYLSRDQSSSSETSVGEIIGILSQLRDNMAENLAKNRKEKVSMEKEAAAMKKAKQDQIDALQKQVQDKTSRLGEVGVDLASLKGNYDDTKKSLADDRGFLTDLQGGCTIQTKQWAEREKMRSEELTAIAETIKLLNDDAAQNLFKKSLPSPSFLQVSRGNWAGQQVRRRAMQALGDAQRRGQGAHGARLGLVTLALRAKKASFGKVIKMIDEMVTLTGKEQRDDNTKLKYCKKELEQTEGQLKDLGQDISNTGKAIDECKEKTSSVNEELASLTESIKELDEQVAESTSQRKEEHAEYVEKLGTNQATKELLNVAKRTLSKAYIQLATEEEEEAPVFAQVSMRSSSGAKPPPAPEGLGKYKKSKEGSKGVLTLITTLMNDLSKETAKLKTDEKTAQADYEKAMADAVKKRAADARMIGEKESVKAELEMRLHKLHQERKSKRKEEGAREEYMRDLQNDCEWLLANYDDRKKARKSEKESLQQAKAYLSGAK